MAEFLTMQEAEDKFGKKGKTNALQFLVSLHYTVVRLHNMEQVCMLVKLLLTGMQ